MKPITREELMPCAMESPCRIIFPTRCLTLFAGVFVPLLPMSIKQRPKLILRSLEGFWPGLARRQRLKQLGIALTSLDGFAMVWAKCLLENSQGRRNERLGSFQLSSRLVELCQAGETAGHIRMCQPQPLFPNLQGTQEEVFRLLVLPLTLIKYCQIVQAE